MSSGHVDTTIKTAVQNNTVFDAVLDATAIYNWRNEIATKIDGNYDDAQSQLSLKAPLASPAFTGVPTAPQPSTGDNSFKIATTNFVLGQLSGITPKIAGIATPGTSTSFTRGDHVHAAEGYGLSQQAIINAAMEIWQQGSSFTNPANNAYTADMWVNLFTSTGTLPTTITHTQNALTAGELFNSKYSYQVNVNGAGSGFGASDAYGQAQRIEFGTSKLCGNGKKVTISFYAKSSIAGKRIAVGLKQAYGTGGSPSSTEILIPSPTTIRTLTSSMALYTFTFTTNTLAGKVFGTNNDDYLELCIYEMWGATFASNNLGVGTAESFVGSGNINFTEVIVNAGDQAALFQPKSYNDELMACKRYLFPLTDATNNSVLIGYGTAATTTIALIGPVAFQVEMRTQPALIATASDWQLNDGVTAYDATALSIQPNQNGKNTLTLRVTVASGLTQFRTYSLNGDLTVGRVMYFDARL